MIQIRVSYNIYLISLLDELVSDLLVSNPEYRIAGDIGDNPIVNTLSREVGHNPMYYALPTKRGVTFDLTKLRSLRQVLVQMKEESIQIALEVITFELNRIKIDNYITCSIKDNEFELQYKDFSWSGSAESIISATLKVDETCDASDFWIGITRVS
ncbi:hypothetical protein NST41_32450 [Paenibacillus sp. FSL L8-0696]|uniref:hypothetical protein n=1 Tax=Paenibacillus sp. FSL L8-0696 TaxID=2954524 RepID=UPI00311A61BC